MTDANRSRVNAPLIETVRFSYQFKDRLLPSLLIISERTIWKRRSILIVTSEVHWNRYWCQFRSRFHLPLLKGNLSKFLSLEARTKARRRRRRTKKKKTKKKKRKARTGCHRNQKDQRRLKELHAAATRQRLRKCSGF